jgi:hypothetical protein
MSYTEQQDFSLTQRHLSAQRLDEQLSALDVELERDCYQQGVNTLSGELNLYLANGQFAPAKLNKTIVKKAQIRQLHAGDSQYKIRYQLAPIPLQKKPFTQMENELNSTIQAIDNCAQSINSYAVPMGILPTLKASHLSSAYVTEEHGYQALAKALREQQSTPLHIDIHGKETLTMDVSKMHLDGANGAFKFSQSVTVSEFANYYNAAQLSAPLVLAISANSPLVFGRRLWQENRIALYKQSIDNRLPTSQWHQPSRVNYGNGWVRHGIKELLQESVALYPLLLPITTEQGDNQDPFTELNLHHNTVWSWNKGQLNTGKNGHLSIQYCSLPVGPTAVDMTANAALQIGLTLALSKVCEQYLPKLPFQYAEFNFYRCAQKGLDALILWPRKHQHQLTECKVTDVLTELLPFAADALIHLGINAEEVKRYINLIEHRLAARQTGATWQLNSLEKLKMTHNEANALRALTRRYYENTKSQQPVAYWE